MCYVHADPLSSRHRSPWFLTAIPEERTSGAGRGHLLARLDGAVAQQDLVLVAAPSGFGKTALLSAWARARDGRTAWLTLTRYDAGDVEMLLMGILSSLRRLPLDDLAAPPGAGAVPPGLGARELLGRIATRVSFEPEPVVVIIDDAHHAGSALADDVIGVLTRLTDGRMRFVVSGSLELLPWFAKSIAAARVTTITSPELALTPTEIVAYAAAVNRPVGIEQANSLHEATGGWPIALHLHLFSANRDTVVELADDGLLTDYIDTHVLAAIRPRLRAFVLAATTCSRVDVALASALSDDPGADTLLEECMSVGLFLDRFRHDDGHVVYRWQEEFARACRRITARDDPRRSRELEGIAARTLAPLFPSEALSHAVRAGDNATTLAIMRASWLRILVESGARQLYDTALTLPSPLADHPEVLVIRACCLNMLGDRTGARVLAASAASQGGEDPQFLSVFAFAQLFLADDADELYEATEHAQRLLEQNGTDAAMYAYRLFLVGWAQVRLRRDVPRSVAFLRSAMHEAETARLPLLARRASSNLLFGLSYGGRFSEARALMTQALDADGDDLWKHYDGGIALFSAGFTAYWSGDADASTRLMRELVDDDGHEEDYSGLGRVYLAFLAADDGAAPTIREAQRLIADVGRRQSHGVPWPVYRALANAELLAASGHHDRAMTWVEQLRGHTHVPIVQAAGAELARRAGHPGLAMDMLSTLTDAQRSISYIGAAAEVTAALVAHERGDDERAHQRLERALAAAAREDVLRPFQSRAPELRVLLSEHVSSGTDHSEFLAGRLAALEGSTDASGRGSALSTREHEILGYLRTTMTAQEIADTLFVSVNTVRTHQRAIYRKLGVAGRRDAVRMRM